MGQVAVHAHFQLAIRPIFEYAAAILAPRVQRAVTKEAVELHAVWHLVAGIVYAVFVCKKSVAVFHFSLLGRVR